MLSTRELNRSSFTLAALAGLLLAAPLPAAQAPQSLLPGENLVAEGIPPIPAALAQRAGPYMEFRSAQLLDWHPTRREILISTRFGATAQLHRVAFPGGARQQITFFPDPIAGARYRPKPRGSSADRGAQPPADGLVYGRDAGGSEFFQLYWRDAGTGQDTLITDGRSRNQAGPFSNSGRWLAYVSTRRNGRDWDVYVVDPADPKSDRCVAEVSGGRWLIADWSPDDRALLAGELISANESRLYLIDVATGEKTLLTPQEGEPVAWSNAVFDRDGRGVYLTTDQASEFQRLAHSDLKSKKLEILTESIPWDVNAVALSENGRWLAFVVNEAGSETLHVLDTRSRKERPLPRLPLGVVGGILFHANSRELAFSLSSARSPSDVFSIDLQAGKVERWTESETGGLDATTFVEPEPIRWKSFDGREITGFLYRPPSRFTGPRPVMIDIHGGPEGQSQPRFLGRSNYFLNELGVALIYPNVRGSIGFGKSFLKLDNWEKREDSVKDIGSLLDWIDRQTGLDAARVAVTGGSYGGYMVYAVMIHYGDRLRGGIDAVGISNFVTFLERTEAYRRDQRRVEYGDERDPRMREFLLRISPLTNASKIRKPLFIIAGQNDPRVSYKEAEQMVAAIRQNGARPWYLLAKDEGHGFARRPNQDFLFLAGIRFVEEVLLK